MATDKPRYNITVDDELLADIEKYRYENKISTRSKATIGLIRLGIEELLREREREETKKNTAPTAAETAEAIYTILYYQYNRPPTDSEIDLFGDILPILIDGVKDK